MSWKLVWTRPALRDMKKLDQQRAHRVREGLTRLAETGQGDVKKLTDVDPPEWRLRVGDRRVFFQYATDPKQIQVLRVVRRDQAY
ncbi:MAG: type II toxin-antitoxin system RelE/ParE family toxin [Longimicrobiales bacterium]|nr:type II toxin-antitoxin system RelE/ParE family toxin [Longimicrobiales bacterium]